ncbi:MAG: hypothetical protein HDS14_07610 [Bacteroides sp.]|nr:hypothetical protein [Bacteroides sp.]
MSWQCPICETVNQDVTPVCTVCDSIAPVIESYLSLEAIELLREYNEKLDSIHSFEASGNFKAMLDTAMEAIALYKENSLARDKAKHALIHLNNDKVKSQISTMLHTAMEKKNYLAASVLFKLMDLFPIDTIEFSDIRTEVRNQLSRKNDIDKVLNESYKAIIELDTTRALQFVEEGLSKYPSSKFLQFRRDDIKKLINLLNDIKKPEEKRKQYPRPPHKGTELGSTIRDVSTDTTIIDLKPTKRKYPKVKRK